MNSAPKQPSRRPSVAVVGFPNVGKSTLVNRLAGGREAVAHSEPGVTRDRKRIACEWNGLDFDLIDTGGIDFDDQASIAYEIRRQAGLATAEADMILLVVDGRAGLRAGDSDAATLMRRAEVPVQVVVNKVDRPEDEHSMLPEFYALGLGDPLPVSAAQGIGTGDLLDRVVDCLGSVPERPDPDGVVSVAVIGRPNVGKSSMVNAILGDERVIVSDQAGTTRDSIDTEVLVDETTVKLLDTAGLRRRSKVGESVDYYGQLRTEQSVARADVAVVVCDACEGLTAEDFRVADLAMRSGAATLVVLNKWDISDLDIDDARARAARKLRLRPEVVTTSALTGRNVGGLLGKCIALAERARKRIPTPDLNRVVADLTARTPPPSRRGKRLRLYYSAQIGDSPIRIVIQVNDRRLVKRDWAFHLENRLRDIYGLAGVPLVIDFVNRSRRGSEG